MEQKLLDNVVSKETDEPPLAAPSGISDGVASGDLTPGQMGPALATASNHPHRRRRHHKSKQHGEAKHSNRLPSRKRLNQPTDEGQHVMFELGVLDREEEEERTPPAFVELDELHLDAEMERPAEWRETARWIKFEEDVEEYADRWSKPHVATPSLMSLFEVRSCMAKAAILLNLSATNIEQIADAVVDELIDNGSLTSEQREETRGLFLLRHVHLHDRVRSRHHLHHHSSKGSQIPLIRSLADIGKRHSAKEVTKVAHSQTLVTSVTTLEVGNMEKNASTDAMGHGHGPANADSDHSNLHGKYDMHFMKKVPAGSETCSILTGEVPFLTSPFAAFVRLKESVLLTEMAEVPVPTRFIFILLGTKGNRHKYLEVGRAMGALFSDEFFHDFAFRSKSRDDLLAGIDEFLSAAAVLPPCQWDPTIRIEPPAAVPSQLRSSRIRWESRKYCPQGRNGSPGPEAAHMDGQDSSLKDGSAQLRPDGTGAIHHEVSFAALPTGGDPPRGPSKTDLAALEAGATPPGGGEEELDRDNDPALARTGRIFGGFVNDIKRRYPYYLSDIRDGLHIQCFASFFFLYFACVTPIITFGGLLAHVTGGYLGTMESIISGAVVGILYSLFAGQPLTIMGSTGPVLVFESIIYKMCSSNRWAYLSFRLWIGIWSSLFLMVMVAFDASALVKFITRFTEESFALLIALIFIYEAFKKMFSISKEFPVNLEWSPNKPPLHECICLPPSNLSVAEIIIAAREKDPIVEIPFIGNETVSLNDSVIDWNYLSEGVFTWDSLEARKVCSLLQGNLTGEHCPPFYAPDVFFFSIILFFATFFLSYKLKAARNSLFFPTKVRSLIADFSVMIAITLCTVIDYFVGFQTPKLNVPLSFEPTLGFKKRGWIVYPFDGNPWWSSLVAVGPALIAVILIFMDQQITAVIVNRREHKLKKGAGYHLDLFIVAITLLINSFLGIPWFVAATVLSINHILSLKKESESSAPGERPVFLGCREQRVTGVLIFGFIGLSVFMAPLLRKIPMPVLYGVFLLMGISSLGGVQMVQRIALMFMPVKYQPDLPFLRHVRVWRIHLFTAIQVICLALLWTIKSISAVSILFPIMVLAMCFIRKGLEFIFTQHELKWLDDLLPESTCSKRRKRKNSEDEYVVTDTTPTVEIHLANELSSTRTGDKPVSVSEEVSKTLIWRQLSGLGLTAQGDTSGDESKHRSKSSHKKHRHHDGESKGGKRHHKKKRHSLFRSSSIDRDGGLAADMQVLFEIAPDNADANSKDGVAMSGNQANQAPSLQAPQILINPPSNQPTPCGSRRGSRL